MLEKELDLLKPIKINKLTVKNRMVMPPMGTNFSNPDHSVSDKLKKYIEARAKGGVGLIILEYSAVDPGGLAAPYQLGIFDDKHIPGLKELANVAHKYYAKIGIQIHHGGIHALPELVGQPVAPSAINGAKELTKEEIKDLVAAFAKAAGRAKTAGLDLVEIHGAHGYLINQFMSPFYNKRTDEYGGNLEKRLRFPMEVYQAVRKEVGPDYLVTFRLSGVEYMEGGKALEDCVVMAKRLAEAGIDAIHVSGGLIESVQWIITPATSEPGYNVPAAAAIKAAVNVPVIVVGKIHTPELAEEIIRSGKADMVALGRALIVDPEFPNKVASGQWDNIRKCLYCLQHCLDIPAACTQNPDFGHEAEYDYKPADIARNVLVVGGGPAGLEAARIAASRGHKVTLFERENILGGQMNIASVPPYKSPLNRVVEFRARQIKNLGVKVTLGKELTIEDIKIMKPEVVILATGSVPFKPNIPGINGDNVVTAWDVLKGSASVGENVLIIGGGSVGAETADYLSSNGKKVTIIEMLEEIAADTPYIPKVGLMERLKNNSVTMMTSTKLCKINTGEIEVEQQGQTKVLTGVDTVVLAIGARSLNTLGEKIANELPGVELHVIGDAKESRTLWQAIGEGAAIGNVL